MPSTVTSGGRDDEVSPDARPLPARISGVKPKSTQPKSNLPLPPAAAANGHIETVVRVIALGPFRRLVVSHVVAPSKKPYASVRAFMSTDGAAFSPTKAGVMIQLAVLDEVIDALKVVRDVEAAQ